jgi:hypothetical protein
MVVGQNIDEPGLVREDIPPRKIGGRSARWEVRPTPILFNVNLPWFHRVGYGIQQYLELVEVHRRAGDSGGGLQARTARSAQAGRRAGIWPPSGLTRPQSARKTTGRVSSLAISALCRPPKSSWRECEQSTPLNFMGSRSAPIGYRDPASHENCMRQSDRRPVRYSSTRNADMARIIHIRCCGVSAS